MVKQLPELSNDGLITPEVGPWGKLKYRLVKNYSSMFSTGMKNKWDCRVYIDLFSGSGRAKLKDSLKIIPATPLIAAGLKDKFDQYIFCEADSEKISTLKQRIERDYKDLNTSFINKNINLAVDQILSGIPQHYKGFKVLSFCVIDPYRMENIEFNTIKQLSRKFMDFFVLIPNYMDANRNLKNYIKKDNKVVDKFLGMDNWREIWEEQKDKVPIFGIFILNMFSRQMSKLDYKVPDKNAVLVRSNKKNLPLYYLNFYSKNKTGINLWYEARKYSIDQYYFKLEG